MDSCRSNESKISNGEVRNIEFPGETGDNPRRPVDLLVPRSFLTALPERFPRKQKILCNIVSREPGSFSFGVKLT